MTRKQAMRLMSAAVKVAKADYDNGMFEQAHIATVIAEIINVADDEGAFDEEEP
jgi:hypothetical protein